MASALHKSVAEFIDNILYARCMQLPVFSILLLWLFLCSCRLHRDCSAAAALGVQPIRFRLFRQQVQQQQQPWQPCAAV